MKALGNKIYIRRGENFTLLFGQHDNSPLVITNKYQHPFIVVVIKSTQYKQDNQYVSTRFLDCRYVQKFEENKIVHLGVGTVDTVTVPSDDTGYKRVYSIADENGESSYYCYDGTKLKEYSFVFTVTYDTEESDTFVDREYLGEVHLIDGESMAARLFELCNKYNLTLSKQTMTNAYNALTNIHAKELSDLMLEYPLSELTADSLLLKFNLIVEV